MYQVSSNNLFTDEFINSISDFNTVSDFLFAANVRECELMSTENVDLDLFIKEVTNVPNLKMLRRQAALFLIKKSMQEED